MAEVSEKKVTREALLAEPSSETPGKPKKSKSKKAPAKKASAKKHQLNQPQKGKKIVKNNKRKHPKSVDFGCLQGQAQYNLKEI